MRKYISLILFLSVIAFSSEAIASSSLKLGAVRCVWKTIDLLNNVAARTAALPEGVTSRLDIRYTQDNEKSKSHLLDVYTPQAASSPLPVIVYIHGGGFVSGDKRHTRQYCMTLAHEGYVVVNANYRLAPKATITDEISDILDVLEWVRHNSGELSIDLTRLVLAGNSAGAYLVSLTSCILTNPDMSKTLGITFDTSQPPVKVKGLLLFSGLYDLETGASRPFPSIHSDVEMLLGTRNLKTYHDISRWSVVKNLTKDFPPSFISSGARDGLYQESLALSEALARVGVLQKPLLFERSEKGVYHDYQAKLKSKAAQKCLQEVKDFLASVTGPR